MSENLSGCLLNISQNVFNKTSGCLLKISQNIFNKQGGCLLKISQNVRNKIHKFQFEKQTTSNNQPFDISVYIDNLYVNPCELTDKISITYSENQSAIAELTLLARCGEIDFYEYAGNKIEIYCNFENENKKLFSGIINTPEIDFYSRKIKMKCTNNKSNLLNNLNWNTINSIGFYSQKMFEDLKSKEDIFNKRIETVQKSYFFDENNDFNLFDWNISGNGNSIEIEINQCDIFQGSFSVTALKTSEIVNKINLLFQFQYNRHIQRDLPQSYYGIGYGGTSNVEFLDFVETYHFIPSPPVSSVVQSVKAAGWTVGSFNYTGLPPATEYHGWYWSPSSYQNYYATAANWKISKRWSQNIQENYKISIYNQQSIDLLGEKSEDLTLSFKIDNNNEDWKDYKCYQPPPSGEVGNGDRFLELNQEDMQEYLKSFNYALNFAKTKIYQSHRQNEIKAEIKFNSAFKLGNVLKLDNANFQGKAVVTEITQEFDFATKIAKTSFVAKWVKHFYGDAYEPLIPYRAVLPIPQYADNQMVFGNVIKKQYAGDINDENLFNFCSETAEDELYGYVLNETLKNQYAKIGTMTALKFAVKTPDIEKESTDGILAEREEEQNLYIFGENNKIKISCKE